MASCEKCGNALADKAVFCDQCGNQTAGNGEEKAAAEPTPKASLVLSTTRKLGFFKSAPCYLVFQEHEILFAHLSKATEKVAIQQYRKELKEQGMGFLGITLAMANFWKNYGQRYYTMSKQDILAHDGLNMAIPYAAVSQFFFDAAKEINRVENTTGSTAAGRIEVVTASGKMKFTHTYYDRNKNIKKVFDQTVSGVLKYKAPRFWGKTITVGSKEAID